MTLLQTRVDEQTASKFRQAARKREMSPYQLLNQLVTQVATESPEGWTEHFARMKARKRPMLPENAVITTRKNETR